MKIWEILEYSFRTLNVIQLNKKIIKILINDFNITVNN